MSQNEGMFGVHGTGDTSGFGGLVRTGVSTGSSERPYGSYFDDVADDLERAYPDFNDAIEAVVVQNGELKESGDKSGDKYAYMEDWDEYGGYGVWGFCM